MKQRRPARSRISAALSLTLALAFGAAIAFATRAGAQVPPPPPIPNPNATPLPTAPPATPVPALTLAPSPSPSPSPAPRGRHKHGAEPAASTAPGASPTPTPTSPAFATLDGTWEMQLQYMDRTLYSYLDLKQDPAGGLSGRWRRDGKLYPLEGSYDGRNFKMVVTFPTGPVTLTGFVEAASDMIGLVDTGKGDPTPFTAEHRAAQPRGILRRDDVVPGGQPH